jgi:hypothetical protein
MIFFLQISVFHQQTSHEVQRIVHFGNEWHQIFILNIIFIIQDSL